MQSPSPNCRQRIRASLLRLPEKRTSFKAGLIAGLPSVPGGNPLEWCRELFEKSGFRSLDELKGLPGLPPGTWVCRDLPKQDPPVTESDLDPLLHAAILGLCNLAFYSPDRPIIWTESRLQRRVELFAVGDFYAH